MDALGTFGVVLGATVSVAAYAMLYGWSAITGAILAQPGALAVAALESLLARVELSVTAALYPGAFAARRVPADALRSNIGSRSRPSSARPCTRWYGA